MGLRLPHIITVIQHPEGKLRADAGFFKPKPAKYFILSKRAEVMNINAYEIVLSVLDRNMKKIVALSLLAGLLLSPLAIANAATTTAPRTSKASAKSGSHLKKAPKHAKTTKAPKTVKPSHLHPSKPPGKTAANRGSGGIPV